MKTFAQIIDAWPSHHEFAKDAGITPTLAAVWKHRNSIPSDVWKRIVVGAENRKINGISLDTLATIAAARKGTSNEVAA